MNTAIEFSDDDWLTPRHLLQQFGRFDLDPATPLTRPWDTATKHYNVNDNGLVLPWFGRVWLNPPRTETKWFFNGVWDIADAVFFPKARFKFFRPDGETGQTGKIGSVIAAYSEEDARFLYSTNTEGKFICLRFKIGAEVKTSWRRLVRYFMQSNNGVCTLEQLYELASDHPKAQANQNWKAKVRQQVQREATRIAPGVWKQNVLIPN